jgi:twitching motility protein PilT
VTIIHINDLLKYAVEQQCSDLHLKTGTVPTVRISGHLAATAFPELDEKICAEMADQMMDEGQAEHLEKVGEVDFGYTAPDLGRFRVNVHRTRGTIGISARRILPEPPSFQALGLPEAVEALGNEHRGLVLITGPTSSGKTTTTGAILGHINASRACHILTIEDPIEILHDDNRSIVTQREIGQDTHDFASALRAAMRQDPDVIFVGEIRDMETVKAALQAAETGHFVLATLHTTNATETINRIIEFFPPHEQKQTRVALAGALVGVISQRLLPKAGGGRVAAIEVMVMNGRIRDLILDPDRTHEIVDIIAESGFYGMQTFDQAVVELVKKELVSMEDAKAAATNPHDFELALKQQGVIAI